LLSKSELVLNGLSKEELLSLLEKYQIMIEEMQPHIDHKSIVAIMTIVAMRIKNEITDAESL